MRHSYIISSLTNLESQIQDLKLVRPSGNKTWGEIRLRVSHTGADSVWRLDLFQPVCPDTGGRGGKRLQHGSGPACRAKAQFLLQLFLLLSVGEADNRRKEE